MHALHINLLRVGFLTFNILIRFKVEPNLIGFFIDDIQTKIVYQKALIRTFHTTFWLHNNICEFTVQEHQFRR